MYFLYCGCTASDELWDELEENWTDTWPTIHDSISLWRFDGRTGSFAMATSPKLRAMSYCCQDDQTSAESSDMNYT